MRFAMILRWLDDMVFTPTCPAPLCVFRVLYGIMVLVCISLWIPDLYLWFGPEGMPSMAAVRMYENDERYTLFTLLPNSNALVLTLFCTLFVAAFMVTIGFRTRISAAVVFVLLVSFQVRGHLIMNSSDTLLRLSAFLLMFSPAGEMFSVDAYRKGLKTYGDQWTARASPFIQRLLQWQVVFVYVQACFFKTEGAAWLDGTAIYYVTRCIDFRRLPVPYLLDHMWTIKALTWGTLLIELAFCTIVWFKEVRYYILLGGIALHLGIEWTMNIPNFEWIMIAMYINFVDPDDLKKVMDRLHASLAHKHETVEKAVIAVGATDK